MQISLKYFMKSGKVWNTLMGKLRQTIRLSSMTDSRSIFSFFFISSTSIAEVISA